MKCEGSPEARSSISETMMSQRLWCRNQNRANCAAHERFEVIRALSLVCDLQSACPGDGVSIRIPCTPLHEAGNTRNREAVRRRPPDAPSHFFPARASSTL